MAEADNPRYAYSWFWLVDPRTGERTRIGDPPPDADKMLKRLLAEEAEAARVYLRQPIAPP